MDRTFIIVTKDFSGLAYAYKLAQEGEHVILAHRFEIDDGEDPKPGAKFVGKGMVERMEFDELWKKRAEYKDAHWHFDMNFFPFEGEILRRDKFPHVWGGSKLADRMEHDREFGVQLVEKAGLKTPETFEFKTPEEGIYFLDSQPDRAFVFKPNENVNGWETYVPDSEKDPVANEELHAYLQALPKGNSGGFILQERLKGVEACFEIWVRDGKPFFAYCELECKRRNNDDLGGLVGGAQDIGFFVPLECKGIRETVGKLLELPEFKHYSGFLDMNVIISDNQNYFLEFCARYGYPQHVTTFYALAKSKVGDILANLTEGDVDNFYDHFKFGFAAGITLSNVKPGKGYPVYIDPDVEKQFAPYDLYRRDKLLLTAGIGEEVGVITGHGFSTIDAAEEALENAKKIHFPNRAMRTDLAKDDYPSNPRDRYLALVAMRYLE